MTHKVLVLGGYGNFGKRICMSLARKGVSVIIVGRDQQKASALAAEIGPMAEAVALDATQDLAEALEELRPVALVNTVGPFQGQGYHVARACISQGVHYIDLADGREFVCGIETLDNLAKDAGVCVISGASTVPALSDAVLAKFAPDFASIDHMKYGISPGQGAERGLATTKAILGYVGKKLGQFPSIRKDVYGWQDTYRQAYPELGNRWMANCEVPDLDLLPERYELRSIQFSAGMELGLIHFGLWALAWLVRLGVPVDLAKFAGPLLSASNLFNRFGSSDGGMHVIITGVANDQPDEVVERSWFIVAKDSDGPHIPTIPSIILAQRLAQGGQPKVGAYPCLGLIDLEDYLAELSYLNIRTFTSSRAVPS